MDPRPRLFRPLLLLTLFAACKSTPEREIAPREGEPETEINISADELEPMENFLSQTRRILAAEFVRVEMTPQFFESRLGFTRDLRFVERKQWDLPDGTRVVEMKNINSEQTTNIDPDLLPRIYFGTGLEVRAYSSLRVYLRRPKGRERPLFLEIVAKNSVGDAKMWIGGRLDTEQPTIRIRSELLWSEDKERYIHKAFIG